MGCPVQLTPWSTYFYIYRLGMGEEAEKRRCSSKSQAAKTG